MKDDADSKSFKFALYSAQVQWYYLLLRARREKITLCQRSLLCRKSSTFCKGKWNVTNRVSAFLPALRASSDHARNICRWRKKIISRNDRRNHYVCVSPLVKTKGSGAREALLILSAIGYFWLRVVSEHLSIFMTMRLFFPLRLSRLFRFIVPCPNERLTVPHLNAWGDIFISLASLWLWRYFHWCFFFSV